MIIVPYTIYQGRREAGMIPSALGCEGMWSKKALQRQSDGKGKRSGSGYEAGKGATGREIMFLKGPRWIAI